MTNFLLAISEIHKVNINVSPELSQIIIANNFSNVTVADLLVFLCKEYDLTIDFTGNILSIKKFQQAPPVIEERVVPIAYNPSNNFISIDANADPLYGVFKKIMDESGKNLVFSPGLENRLLTTYIQEMPFDKAMDNLAFANNLFVEKTKDGFFVFEDNAPINIPDSGNPNSGQVTQRPIRRRNSNFFFKAIDSRPSALRSILLIPPFQISSMTSVMNWI